ncbi:MULTISPECIES: hypothetical protein [Asticcacaulis]|uniref:hypothetical protein n=1 Tax=Asticcacaulis TaxID=76890 RepID=UPI001AE751ED|nr:MULTISPECIES: hypothetical protein [Asticcacaulis]MBP2158166.1 hypothetical protein [Asticcacaulis solisilvae]MDR6799211.1 hypothetical protein [Asticcacaulis sp. BE141]
MLQSWVTQLGACAVALVCLYAIVAGTWRERFGAFIYLSGYLLTMGFSLVSSDHIAAYMLVADVICLLGFYIACWNTQHPWPQWALLGQIVSVAIDIIVLLNIGVGVTALLVVQTIAAWGVLLALLIGTIAVTKARRAARKSGVKKAPMTKSPLTKSS